MKYSILAILLVITSCVNPDYTLYFPGHWKSTSWQLVDSETNLDFEMRFHFTDDYNYTLWLDGHLESGRYYYTGRSLFIKVEDQPERMFTISSISQDSLLLRFRQGGALHDVLLLKEEERISF